MAPQLLLRSRGLSSPADAAVGAVPGAEGLPRRGRGAGDGAPAGPVEARGHPAGGVDRHRPPDAGAVAPVVDRISLTSVDLKPNCSTRILKSIFLLKMLLVLKKQKRK